MDEAWKRAAQRALDEKTKPPGSLGILEELAVELAALQRSLAPRIDRGRILVFAADHGVSHEGVSAYPRQVTTQMMYNFSRGGAAINVLARSVGLEVEVIDVGVDEELPPLAGVISDKVRRGSRNFLHEPAMTSQELCQAQEVGQRAVRRAVASGVDVVGLGEMGIGNSTSASTLLSALTGAPPEETVGAGTGLDGTGLERKRQVVKSALRRHAEALAAPENCLAAVGGLEIAALASAAAEGARHRLAVVVDGFIATVAVLAAVRLDPAIRPALFFAHRSAETGHDLALSALGARAILDLKMRLGEGTGAALAIPILAAGADLLREMATFAEAGVSSRLDE